MRRLLLVIFTFVACSSCADYLKISTNTIDFSHYSAKGFFLTPAPSLEKAYEPLAEVSICIANYWDWKRTLNADMLDEIDADRVVQNLANFYEIKDIGVYDYALCKLIYKAMSLGGDAIINLRIVETTGDRGLGELNVSGFAIRQK